MEEEEPWIQLGVGMEKKVIRAGSRGKRPRFWSQVEVEASLAGHVELRIGEGSDKWARWVDTALQLMDEGEESRFRVRIDEDSTATFDLHLIRIISLSFPLDSWSPDDVLRVAEALKDRGVSLHKAGRITDSFHHFSRALRLVLPLEERHSERFRGLISSLYNNLAACQLDQSHFPQALYLSGQALERRSSDVKALYRKASALSSLKEYQGALDAIKSGLEVEPANKALLNLKRKVLAGSKEEDAVLAQSLKRFFQ